LPHPHPRKEEAEAVLLCRTKTKTIFYGKNTEVGLPGASGQKRKRWEKPHLIKTADRKKKTAFVVGESGEKVESGIRS
jgi:hypothetical protein